MLPIEDLAPSIRKAQIGTAWKSEDTARKLKRARRLGQDLPEDADPGLIDDALERVLGSNDLRPVRWLSIGERRADAVGKVDTPAGSGTGFMVSPWLLMTNNHVISSAAAASSATVTFRYQQDASGNIRSVKTLNLDSARFFRTSPSNKLDYTLDSVAPATGGKAPGDVYGFLPLIGGTGKILEGEPINIVQHPWGRPTEIAFRNNLLLSIDDDEKLTYQTDTESGSSGSPVFNDQWEMVALHHKSVEAANAEGVKIDRMGNPVTAATPENLRVWVANEGIRVSALVRDIQSSSYRGARRQLVDEVLGRNQR